MPRNWTRVAALAMAGAIMIAVSAGAGDPTASLKQGQARPQVGRPARPSGPTASSSSATPRARPLFAIDTGDRTAAGREARRCKVKDLGGKVAGDARHRPQAGHDQRPGRQPALGQRLPLGLARPRARRAPGDRPDQRRRQARGAVAGERPVRQGRDPQRPAPRRQAARAVARNESITDLAYVDGRVFLAGLSNEEFSSRLIAIPFPFSDEASTARRSRSTTAPTAGSRPSRRSAPSSPTRSSNEPYLLAAYTCTPLVKVPVADLKAGAHVKGTTIAELGNRNRPLDMIVYQKDGKDYLLMANSSRGVMKIPTEGAGTRRGHHRARSTADQGPRLRDDRQPQGRRPDGSSSTTATP